MADASHHSMQEIHHGHPAWTDLATHDLPAAREFYSALFGWKFVDQGEDFGGYHMIMKGGREVGGAMNSSVGPEGSTDESRSQTGWTVYLRVDDMDKAVKSVTDAGGIVLFDPRTVGDAGRMTVVTDPAGAVIGLWEADVFPGFSKAALTGMPVWFEVMTRGFDAAAPFYETVARWDLTYLGEDGGPAAQPPEGGVRYATNGPPETATAGICDASSFLPEGTRSYWRLYLGVTDVDAAVERIRELGGSLLDGPMNSPFGRVATVADPQGASFQIIQA